MSQSKKPGWKEIPRGGVILEAGNAAEYETGSWRSMRPIRDDRCINCLRCWIFCPDSAIVVEDGKVLGINLDHCKGCGICAYECPPKIQNIAMVLETEAAKND